MTLVTFRAAALRGLFLILALHAPGVALAEPAVTEEKPKPGMAVLNAEYEEVGLRIGVLDGKSQRRGFSAKSMPTTVHVKPGRHTVRLQFADGQYVAEGHFWWDAEADKAYWARYAIDGQRIDMWIEEEGTGRRVGGVGDGKDEGVATSMEVATGKGAKAPPPAPDATTAILVSNPGDGPTAMIFTWDGKTMDRQEVVSLDRERQSHGGNEYQTFRLAPGRHTLVLHYRRSTLDIYETLAFTVEANRTYWVRRQTENYAVRFWVEDAVSGTRVSEAVRR